MSDGAISIKLAPDYEMGAVQKQLEDYGTGEDIIRMMIFSLIFLFLLFAINIVQTAQSPNNACKMH